MTEEEALLGFVTALKKSYMQGAVEVSTEVALRAIDFTLASVGRLNAEAKFCDACKTRAAASAERTSQRLRMMIVGVFKGFEFSKEDLLDQFKDAMGSEYLARWAALPPPTQGDSSVIKAAVDVFNVPVDMQRELLKRLEPAREITRAILGTPALFMFHTPEATAEHYADVVAKLKKERPK